MDRITHYADNCFKNMLVVWVIKSFCYAFPSFICIFGIFLVMVSLTLFHQLWNFTSMGKHSLTIFFCIINISWFRKDVETHFNHYIRYVAPNHKTIFFLKQGKHSHRPYARSPSLCAISTSLLSYDLAKMLFYVRWGVGAIARRLIDYAYFALHEFRS